MAEKKKDNVRRDTTSSYIQDIGSVKDSHQKIELE